MYRQRTHLSIHYWFLFPGGLESHSLKLSYFSNSDIERSFSKVPLKWSLLFSRCHESYSLSGTLQSTAGDMDECMNGGSDFGTPNKAVFHKLIHRLAEVPCSTL